MKVQPLPQFSALPCTHVTPVSSGCQMIKRIHKFFAKGFFCMLSGIIRISAKEVPAIGIPPPYHALIAFPPVTAQPFKVLLYEILRFGFLFKHGRKLPQQLCLAICSFALRFVKKASSNCCNSSLFSGFFRLRFFRYGRFVCGMAIQLLPSK